jgi:hypothetical protein
MLRDRLGKRYAHGMYEGVGRGGRVRDDTHTRKRFIQQEHHHKMARLKLQLLVALKDSGFVDFKLADT